jgi:hypothetical protein
LKWTFEENQTNRRLISFKVMLLSVTVPVLDTLPFGASERKSIPIAVQARMIFAKWRLAV